MHQPPGPLTCTIVPPAAEVPLSELAAGLTHTEIEKSALFPRLVKLPAWMYELALPANVTPPDPFHVAPVSVPVWPSPVTSAVVVPLPSFSGYSATRFPPAPFPSAAPLSQALAEQMWDPPMQTTPHAEQLDALLVVLASHPLLRLSSQFAKPALQATPHVVPLQTVESLFPPGCAAQQVPLQRTFGDAHGGEEGGGDAASAATSGCVSAML